MTTATERIEFCYTQIAAQRAKIANIERSMGEMARAKDKAERRIAGYEARIAADVEAAEFDAIAVR